MHQRQVYHCINGEANVAKRKHYTCVNEPTRKHSSRMGTTRWEIVRVLVSVTATRCHSGGSPNEQCCYLTFRAFRALIPNLDHLYIIEVLMHANATIVFKDHRYDHMMIDFHHNDAFTV